MACVGGARSAFPRPESLAHAGRKTHEKKVPGDVMKRKMPHDTVMEGATRKRGGGRPEEEGVRGNGEGR